MEKVVRKIESLLLLAIFMLNINLSRADPAILYPFGTSVGDLVSPKNDDGFVGPLNIGVPLQFFSSVYQTLFVNTNGGVSFGTAVSQFTPDAFPLRDGRLIVAAFWADVDTTRNNGNLFYRTSVDDVLLSRISNDIQSYFPLSFHAKGALVVTWDQVTFYGGGANTPINTFQLILTTDGRYSFAIFNYDVITWTTGTASGGNLVGLGGTPAQVGFNAGDGVNFASVTGSRTDSIVNIAFTSNIGKRGRYAFLSDSSDFASVSGSGTDSIINIDAFLSDSSILGACGPAATRMVQPGFGSFFGGKPVTLSGPCFSLKDNIVCKFGEIITKGNLNPSTSDATCIVPPNLKEHGRVSLLVSQNNGTTFTEFPKFLYLSQDPFYQSERDNKMSWDSDSWDGTGAILFDSSYLSFTPEVNLDFVSFRQLDNGDIENKTTRLLSSVANTGKLFLPENLHNVTELVVSMAGALRITSDRLPGVAVWSDLHAATWFLKAAIAELAFREDNGLQQPNIIMHWSPQQNRISITSTELLDYIRTELAKDSNRNKRNLWNDFVAAVKRAVVRASSEICRKYELMDETDFSDLLAPPCTAGQARVDPRFEQDQSCHDGNWFCDFFHNGAYECFRSVVPVNGKGQQVCYDRDGNILPFERGGGTVDKVHPSNWLGHLFYDVVPFFACCKLSSNCDKYGAIRPTQDCRNYSPPRPARTNGDPHFATLDGKTFSFNAIGEFLILSSTINSVIFQGRMIQGHNSNGLVTASIWGAFVMKMADADTVQIENGDSFIHVLVNGIEEDFSDLTTQDFTGVRIEKETDVTVVVKFLKPNQEISIKATLAGGALQYELFLANSYKAMTAGLMGNFNGDADDDLRTPDGNVLPPNTEGSTLHNEYLAWRVSEEDSLFTYAPTTSYDFYQDLTFTPQFLSMEAMMRHPNASLCSADISCLYDLSVTNDVQFAMTTKQYTENYQSYNNILKVEISCGFPNRIQNGSVSFGSTTRGSTASYTCDEGMRLQGKSSVLCQADGTWSGTAICNVSGGSAAPSPPTWVLIAPFIVVAAIFRA